MIEFYRARINYFYSGTIQQIEFNQLDQNVRGNVDDMINTKTNGEMTNFMGSDTIPEYPPPMISFGANYLKVCFLLFLYFL